MYKKIRASCSLSIQNFRVRVIICQLSEYERNSISPAENNRFSAKNNRFNGGTFRNVARMLYLEGMFSLSFRLDISCSLNVLNLRTRRKRRMEGGREISIPRVKQITFSLLSAARSAQTALNQMADVFESGIVFSSMW